MNHRAITALMAGIAPVMRDYVDKAVAPLRQGLAAIEARTPIKGDPGERGADGKPGDIGPAGERGPAGEKGEKGDPGERGADGKPGDIGPAGERGPAGEKGEKGDPGERGADGKPGDIGPAGERGPAGEKGEKGDPGERGADGKTGDIGPAGELGPAGEKGEKGDPGRDGKSVDLEEVAKLIGKEVAKQVAMLPRIVGALIDRDGELIVAYSDGSKETLGRVVGEDGDKGEPGRDGAGFDNVVAFEDAHLHGLRFGNGSDVKEVTWSKPTLADQYHEIWREGEYRRGAMVTWDGSGFVALKQTTAKPGTSSDWRLFVKRGRDGKDGKPGAKGDPGPEGRPGRDLTQLGPGGQKW